MEKNSLDKLGGMDPRYGSRSGSFLDPGGPGAGNSAPILRYLRDNLGYTGLSIWGEVGNLSGYAGLAITAWASIHALRHRGKAYRDGYAIGRAVPQEHRLFR